jgi:hypothetical protein
LALRWSGGRHCVGGWWMGRLRLPVLVPLPLAVSA